MNRRAAFTVLEVTIAIVLLSAAVVAVAQFVATVNQGLRDRGLVRQMGWEIENLREKISSWPLADITAENISAVPCPPSLTSQLDEARWEADVQSIEVPLQATQITLRLKCTLNGQVAAPEQLTFWIETGADSAR